MTSASATSTAPIKDEGDIVPVRQAAREAAAAAGFTLVQQTKLVTAASELARNALVHGGGGQAEIFAGASGVRMVFRDSGPGIADIEQAMTDGFTTGSGLGPGRGGARRLADGFRIDSAPTVEISMSAHR
ncbi:MAG TPA: ATP-binding protein [Amycolatopsis sp.]|uniref:ATP-binding protein n=1 Tax=Amycolatopsis sp. TaxID=37632 RepID=UPI002B4618B8|nr:ATP-binding protein [Amycolatopsis sp.]HKS44060.1 ATP-binding protein [Amycolatopsis sp.]